MSVTFRPAISAEGHPLYRCSCEDGTCRACDTMLDVHERRASDLIAAIGLPERYGILPAREVAACCEARLRALAPEPARAGLERGRITVGGAPAGDTRDTVVRLLEVALVAGEGWVAWS